MSLIDGEYIEDDEYQRYDDDEDDDAFNDDIEDEINVFKSNTMAISDNFYKRYKVGSIPFIPGIIAFKVKNFRSVGGLMSNIDLISNMNNIYDMSLFYNADGIIDTAYVVFDWGSNHQYIAIFYKKLSYLGRMILTLPIMFHKNSVIRLGL